MKAYQKRIAAATAGTPWSKADPAIVECWMRLEYGVLDHLGGAKFDAEARSGAQMTLDHPAESLALAESYGVKVSV